ncbi:hypothetical protein I4U23_015014 [Adineta vaga]|nr:hypothetical protein I4U23_015014 [Adineta vaga]
MLEIFGCISLLVLLIAYYAYYFNAVSTLTECKMSIASNRDFHKYYGIENSRNHFTITTADACDSQIIINSVLPQAVLKQDHSATSFLILSKFGTGKTLLRCEYFKSLSPTQYFKVLILNQHLNDYLERYVSATSVDGVNCESSNCLVGWRKYEFGQVLLSMLVTQLVNEYEKEQFHVSDVSLEEKMKLISIICYYYNGDDINKLENFANYFFEKGAYQRYSAKAAQVQTYEKNKFEYKILFEHFRTDLNKLIVLKKSDDLRLRLLFTITEKEEFQNQAHENHLIDTIFKDLTHFALFIKNHLKKSVVFAIDGIDENRYFFRKGVVNKESISLFFRSSVCPEILASVMAQNFYLSLFYPQIDDIQFQNEIVRKDKFPTLTIQWDTKSLMNYADHVLEKMNKTSSNVRCKTLKGFDTLTNYKDKQVAEVIDRISNPRELHYFMIELILEMNNHANSDNPFIATFDNVNQAYIKASKHFPRAHHL